MQKTRVPETLYNYSPHLHLSPQCSLDAEAKWKKKMRKQKMRRTFSMFKSQKNVKKFGDYFTDS